MPATAPQGDDDGTLDAPDAKSEPTGDRTNEPNNLRRRRSFTSPVPAMAREAD